MFQIFAYTHELLLLLFSLYPSGKQMQVFFFIYVFFSVLFLKI